MGTVWLAKDEKLDDLPVATKLLLPELASDSQFVTSLKEEAKSSMRLSHPNIVQVHGLHHDDHDDKVAFLVLKYIKGCTMKEVLQEWPQGVPIERVLRWARQLGSALDYAHANGVVHRDIKPSNIMIEAESDQAMLMDFGISRHCDQTIRSGTAASKSGLGTLAYMSPQQLHDKDCKSNDIYSLAATLYQTLSGRAPFIGDNIEEEILRKDPDPIVGIPDTVNRALLAGLAKDELDRPESAEDLVDLLMIDNNLAGTGHGESSGTKSVTSGAGGGAVGPNNQGNQAARKSGSLIPKALVAIVVIGGAALLAMNYENIKGLINSNDPATAIATPTSGTNSPGGPGQSAGDDQPTDGGGSTPVDGAGSGDTGESSRVAIVGSPERSKRESAPPQGDTEQDSENASVDHPGHEVGESIDFDDGAPALFAIIRRGDPKQVASALASAKADGSLTDVLDEVDANTGYRLIHAAAASGRVEMVSVVLEAGASIDTLGSMPLQVTALHVAAEFGQLEVVRILIDSGADLSLRDGGQRTALHLAAKRCRNQRDLDLISLLVGAGADIDVRDNHGKKPIDLVPSTSSIRAAAKEVLS
jgi:serine/threonine protein kinase